MALASKPATSSRQPQRTWRTPVSPARLLWLVIAALICAGITLLYLYALATQPFAGPLNEPLRSFGIVAFALVLATAAYALRRRFARHLPGKAQAWLWMHTWLGSAAILVALLHERLTNYCQNASCLTNAYGGMSALIALFVLVLSGIAGRLLDRWQARLVAREASTNGAGIIQASEESLLEQEYQVERLCAGKSEAFKQYCLLAIEHVQATPQPQPPVLDSREQNDFQKARAVLDTYVHLARSLQIQRRATWIMRTWRIAHSVLAVLSLFIISFHALAELLTNVFHFK